MLRKMTYVLCAVLLVSVFPVNTVDAQRTTTSSLWKAKKSKTAHGRSFLSVNAIGASASFRVKGKSFALWYVAGSRNGKVAVFVNGKRVRTINQYAPRPTRRAVQLRGTKKTNTVQVIALATRHQNSRGTRVNVDAFSPSSRSCAKGCRRNPRPTEITGSAMTTASSEAMLFPASVPEQLSSDWGVAVGSYVRARDVLPIDTAIPVIRAAACDQARKVRQGIVVLSFGMQVNGGASGFEKNTQAHL